MREENPKDNNNNVVTRFDSPREMVDHWRNECGKQNADSARTNHWYGGDCRTLDQFDAYLNQGYREDRIHHIQVSVENIMASAEAPIPMLVNDLAGYRPDVPAFCAGLPDSMMRVDDVPEKGLIRVYVGTNSGCNHNADKLQKRGAAIASAINAIQSFRPIEAFTYSSLGSSQYKGIWLVCRLGCTPIDLTELCVPTIETYFDRVITHGIGLSKYGFNGNWANDISEKHIRKVLGLNPHDIVVEPTHNSASGDILDNPDQWVKDTIARASAGDNV
jgi:hypothetical protein